MLRRPLVVLFASLAGLLEPANAVVIDGESRLTEGRYAAEHRLPLRNVRDKFAATGRVQCRGSWGALHVSAQLTGKADVLSTSGHAFFDPGTCKARARLNECDFVYSVRGKERRAKLKELVSMGPRCPYYLRHEDDWAIIRLATPVRDVRPYSAPEEEPDLNSGESVISISGGSSHFFVDGVPAPHTKTIEHCRVRRINTNRYVGVRLETDCDVGPGNSGGAIVRRAAGSLVVVGLHNYSSAKNDEPLKSGPYVQGEWAAFATPLAGEFFKSLKASTGGSAVPESTSSRGLTPDQFATTHRLPLPEVERKFSGTGRLVCGNSQALAHVIGRNDRIASVGYFRDTCAARIDASTCEFFSGGEQPKRYSVGRLLGSGALCSGTADYFRDWAVWQLSKPVEDIQPYEVPVSENYAFGAQNLVSVSYTDAESIGQPTASLETCSVTRNVWTYIDALSTTGVALETDCDRSGRLRGPAFLWSTLGQEFLFIGLGSKLSAESGKLLTNPANQKAQQLSVLVPLTGDFFKAVSAQEPNKP